MTSRDQLNEMERLDALHRYRILDTPPEPQFERLVDLCRRIFGVPIALVSLIDADRQWFKAVRGIEESETPRLIALCDYAIRSSEPFVVVDAGLDDRFSSNPFVTGPPFIRFYAGAPIRTPDGFNIGSVSIIDVVPRELSPEQEATLADLAAVAAGEIEHRLTMLRLEQAEENESVADARFRAIAEEAIVGVYVIENGALTYVNARYAQIFGYEREELIGRAAMDLVAEESRELVEAQMRKRILAEQEVAEYRFMALRRDGRTLVVEVHGVGTKIGESPAIVGTLLDVTGEAEAEERMRASEERYRALADTASDSIIVIDENSRVVFANRATERIFGYEAEELNGVSLTVLMPEELRGRHLEGVACAVAHPEREMTARIAEFIAVGRSGERIPVEISFGRFEERGKPRFVGVVRDVRQRHLLEEQLLRTRQISALGGIAATLAHEFNNVLMAVQPSVEILAGRGAPELRERALGNALKSIQRGKRLTQDVARLGNPQPLEVTAISVQRWMAEVEDEVRTTLPPEIALRVDRGTDDLTIAGDRHQLTAALLNLTNNARFAIAGRGAIEIAAARVEGQQGGSAVEISIRDTGRGIPDEVLPRIFEPFFSTKGARGTGIGLSLVQQIMERHHGEIQVQTGAAGTTFRLRLPLMEHDHRSSEETVDRSASAGLSSVLLIEDDQEVASGLRDVLAMNGISVTWLAEGHEIERYVDRERPDLVVLDITLNDESGMDVAGRILQRSPTLPILFSTGYLPRDQSFEDLLNRPNVGCLLKPYTFQTLLQEFTKLTNR